MLNLLFFTHDPDILGEIRKAIREKDHTLAIAPTDQEAIQLLDHVFISMVIMDFNMSRIQCRSLLTHIQEHYPDIPVLVLSSIPLNPENLPRSITASYVGSPFVKNDLKQIIETETRNLISGGTISNVAPPSLAQLLEMEEKSCVLRVFENKTSAGGLIAFRNGKIVDARFKAFRGIDAACRILAWDQADIYIQNKEYQGQDRITQDLQSIIVKSVHMKDEGHTASTGPAVTPNSAADPTPKPAPAMTSAPPAPRPPQSPSKAQRKKEAFPKTLEQFLNKHLDTRSGVIEVKHDPQVQGGINDSTELGALFDLGRLRLMCSDDAVENGLVVAGTVPTTVRLSPQSPLERITLLITRFLEII